MKLIINYDLLDKIREAKTGISLQRTSKLIVIVSGAVVTLCAIIGAFVFSPEEYGKEILKVIPRLLINQTLIRLPLYLITAKFYKTVSKEVLKKVASALRDINVNTDEDLLLDSSRYKIEYKFKKNDNSTDLVQKNIFWSL